jgi:acetyltransferase-like isoleucine patch superfamily enzyme
VFYSSKAKYTFSKEDKIEEHPHITIGNDVFIGANVTVLEGVTIGDGAIIGAGAVVSKDIPPYAIAVGSTIQIKKYRFEEAQIQALQRIQWWNFTDEQLQEVEKRFFDVEGFIKDFDK